MRKVSVANWPAASEQVLIPNRAHSTASVRIMFSTAARAAPEWTIAGIPLWGERVTLITLPPPPGMKALVAAAWVISQVPLTLRSITVRNPFGEIDSAGARNWPPALLTSRSRRPWRSSRPSKKRSTGSSSRMSSGSNSKRARQPGGQLGRLLERLGTAAAADHGGAETGQLERRLAPEAGAGAGDDADLTVEQTVPKHLRMRAFSHRRASL